MTIFIIENNLDSILECLYHSYVNNVMPSAIVEKSLYQPRLDAVSVALTPIDSHVERVKNALIRYSGRSIFGQIDACIRSCQDNALFIAFSYCHEVLKYRANIQTCLTYPAVSDFFIAVRKVLTERHKFLGFLRFSATENGVMYACYSPENDITELITPHFFKRLAITPFVIHDLKRGKIAISNGNEVFFTTTTATASLTLSENEEEFRALYKKYYSAVNIESRKNLRQQMNFMPKKYRRFMPETYEI